MSEQVSFYNEILKKLDRLNRKVVIQSFLSRVIQISFLFLALLIILSFAEMLGYFSPVIRMIFFSILFFVFTALVVTGLIILIPKINSFFSKQNYFLSAQKVGIFFPVIKDDLINAMQLVTSGKGQNLYSDSLKDAAFRHVFNRSRELKFESIVSFEKHKKFSSILAITTFFCSLLFMMVPELANAAGRIYNFSDEFKKPQKFYLSIYPGNHSITKGDDLTLKIIVNGEKPTQVFLLLKDEEQTDFTTHKIIADSNGEFNHTLNAVRNSFKYYASSGDITSDEYAIKIIDRPVISNIFINITPPAYSGLKSFQQIDNGNITALLGSKIEFRINSSKELLSGELEFSDSSIIKLNTAVTEAKASFNLRKDNSYHINISDLNGNKNLFPISYSIKALYDSYPLIDVLSPAQNIQLGNDNRVNLGAKVSDDFGFNKLLIHYRLAESKYEMPHEQFSNFEIEVPKNLKEVDINQTWNLSNMSLATEDVVQYYFEIFDNDNVSGPKSTKSPTYLIRVPSLDELLAKTDEVHNTAQDELKETLEQAEELKKEIEQIERDMKQDKKELNWQEKEKIENALDKFEKLQDKVEQVSEQLQKMQEQLQENNLLSKETMEKYLELQKLMEQLSSDEMKKAMEKMKNLLQNMNRQQAQQEMQNLKIDEEKFQKSIERTMNLLKRIQIEQKVDELMKRTEEMTKMQEELEQQTSESKNSDQKSQEQLAEKQKEVSKSLKELEEEMKNLSEKMKDMEDMPNDEMEEMMEEFEKQENEELSEQTESELKQNKNQSAMQKQEKLKNNMKKMGQKMSQLQQSMMQQNQMQTFTDMMKILDNLISLSKQQEELRKESQNMDPNSSAFNESAQKQNNLQQSLDKVLQQMSDVSQKTFAITPEMGKALGDAKREMNSAIQSMQNRNSGIASMNQSEAMKSLNEAATMMKSSMESMMQGGSGQGGMMSMMQQLQQMSGQQMSLNNMTQMLQQGSSGQLSPQQQGELQRLGQQQELIRKSLEEMNKEAKQSGQSKRLPANLENIMKQMQEVISDMQTERLDDKLLQKQEKILSRLLDAQKSINERDFEKQRESNTGQNIVRESPSEINLNSEKGRNKVHDELIRSVQEGYTRDYEELIRKYFEALQKESIQN